MELYKCIIQDAKKEPSPAIKKEEHDEEEVEPTKEYELKIKEQHLAAFNDALDGDFKELGFLEFYKLVGDLRINPGKTQTKLINSRYKGCNKICKIFNENTITKKWRRAKAHEKLKFECDISEVIKNGFESYFKKSGENKMDIYDFYKVVDKTEVDVEGSCAILYNQHFKNQMARACCKSLCRRKRT